MYAYIRVPIGHDILDGRVLTPFSDQKALGPRPSKRLVETYLTFCDICMPEEREEERMGAEGERISEDKIRWSCFGWRLHHREPSARPFGAPEYEGGSRHGHNQVHRLSRCNPHRPSRPFPNLLGEQQVSSIASLLCTSTARTELDTPRKWLSTTPVWQRVVGRRHPAPF